MSQQWHMDMKRSLKADFHHLHTSCSPLTAEQGQWHREATLSGYLQQLCGNQASKTQCKTTQKGKVIFRSDSTHSLFHAHSCMFTLSIAPRHTCPRDPLRTVYSNREDWIHTLRGVHKHLSCTSGYLVPRSQTSSFFPSRLLAVSILLREQLTCSLALNFQSFSTAFN